VPVVVRGAPVVHGSAAGRRGPCWGMEGMDDEDDLGWGLRGWSIEDRGAPLRRGRVAARHRMSESPCDERISVPFVAILVEISGLVLQTNTDRRGHVCRL
jgi:hypothetical protein